MDVTKKTKVKKVGVSNSRKEGIHIPSKIIVCHSKPIE